MQVIDNPVAVQLDKIVFATDLQPHCQVAEEYTHALASRFNAKVTVANVIDLSIAVPDESQFVGIPVDQLRQRGQQGVDKTVSALREAGIRSDGNLLTGHNVGACIVTL